MSNVSTRFIYRMHNMTGVLLLCSRKIDRKHFHCLLKCVYPSNCAIVQELSLLYLIFRTFISVHYFVIRLIWPYWRILMYIKGKKLFRLPDKTCFYSTYLLNTWKFKLPSKVNGFMYDIVCTYTCKSLMLCLNHS